MSLSKANFSAQDIIYTMNNAEIYNSDNQAMPSAMSDIPIQTPFCPYNHLGNLDITDHESTFQLKTFVLQLIDIRSPKYLNCTKIAYVIETPSTYQLYIAIPFLDRTKTPFCAHGKQSISIRICCLFPLDISRRVHIYGLQGQPNTFSVQCYRPYTAYRRYGIQCQSLRNPISFVVSNR